MVAVVECLHRAQAPSRHGRCPSYGRLFRRVVNKRRDFEHQLSKRLVDRYGMIATEKLNVAGMTASVAVVGPAGKWSGQLCRAVH
ncbi:MAG: transposase [Proteobacteria bacterium]|nr:transposase [Pseudomonadota bacterium]